MTPQQIQLVRDGFDRLAPIAPEAATMFYNNLFAADTSLRQLFHADMASQGERLMGMIGTAVGMLDRPHALQPLLRRLGARHGGYGVRETHYATVGAALLLTLEQGLGAAFTPAAREAWTAMYGLVSHTMQEPATLQAEAA